MKDKTSDLVKKVFEGDTIIEEGACYPPKPVKTYETPWGINDVYTLMEVPFL